MSGLLTALVPWWVRWLSVATILAAAAGFGAVKMREYDNVRYEKLQLEYSNFKADTIAQGAVAKARAKEVEARDKSLKEKADVAHAKDKKALAVERAANKRLRDERARSGYLPPAGAGSPSPDRACVDRAEFERAMERLDERGAGIAEQGDAAIKGLNNAREWAQNRKEPK